jgi:hypothetical protein
MGADVVGVGIAPFEGDKGGLPRMAVMPRSQARIEMAWDVSGLPAPAATTWWSTR